MSQPPPIRSLRATDLDAAAEVVAAFDPALGRLARRDLGAFFAGRGLPGAAFWCAENGERLVGLVGLYDDVDPEVSGVAWMVWLFVHPDARGGGYGRRLMERALEEGVARGHRKVCLDVGNEAEHLEAIRIYEREGFRREAEMPDYFRPGEDKLVFTLDLEPWRARRTAGRPACDDVAPAGEPVPLACAAAGCHGGLRAHARHRVRRRRLVEGVLRCVACDARYPVLGGVPILAAHPGGYLGDHRHAVLAALAADDHADRQTVALIESFAGEREATQVPFAPAVPLDPARAGALKARLEEVPATAWLIDGAALVAALPNNPETVRAATVVDPVLPHLLARRRQRAEGTAWSFAVATGSRPPVVPGRAAGWLTALRPAEAMPRLAEAVRQILAPGGRLLAVVGDGEGQASSAARLAEELERHGFTIARPVDGSGEAPGTTTNWLEATITSS